LSTLSSSGHFLVSLRTENDRTPLYRKASKANFMSTHNIFLRKSFPQNDKKAASVEDTRPDKARVFNLPDVISSRACLAFIRKSVVANISLS
jgi:hypothetical protein